MCPSRHFLSCAWRLTWEVSPVHTLQKTSNCYRHPGRAGGPPYGLGRVSLGVPLTSASVLVFVRHDAAILRHRLLCEPHTGRPRSTNGRRFATPIDKKSHDQSRPSSGGRRELARPR